MRQRVRPPSGRGRCEVAIIAAAIVSGERPGSPVLFARIISGPTGRMAKLASIGGRHSLTQTVGSPTTRLASGPKDAAAKDGCENIATIVSGVRGIGRPVMAV